MADSSHETSALVVEQAGMRKRRKLEQKAEIAAKEAEKEAKASQKATKMAEKEEKKAAREAKKAMKEEKAKVKQAKENMDSVPAAGSSKDAKRKRRAAVDPEKAGEKTTPKKATKTRASKLKDTPCKIWDPKGTPSKVKAKARQKREEKAHQALAKLRRQRALLPEELRDLKEPQDESKLNLF